MYQNSIFQLNYIIRNTKKRYDTKLFTTRRSINFNHTFFIRCIFFFVIWKNTIENRKLFNYITRIGDTRKRRKITKLFSSIRSTNLICCSFWSNVYFLSWFLKISFFKQNMWVMKKSFKVENYLSERGLRILIRIFFNKIYNLCSDLKKHYWKLKIPFFNHNMKKKLRSG